MKHIIIFPQLLENFSWQLVSTIEPIKRPLDGTKPFWSDGTEKIDGTSGLPSGGGGFVFFCWSGRPACVAGMLWRLVTQCFGYFHGFGCPSKPACIIEIVSDTWWLSWHVTFPLHWSDGQLDTAGFQDCLKLQGPWRRTCDCGRSAGKFKRLIMHYIILKESWVMTLSELVWTCFEMTSFRETQLPSFHVDKHVSMAAGWPQWGTAHHMSSATPGYRVHKLNWRVCGRRAWSYSMDSAPPWHSFYMDIRFETRWDIHDALKTTCWL